jgi:hypothetical protein
MRGTQLTRPLQLLGTAGGGDDVAGAQEPGDLDTGAGDTRAGGVDEDVLVRFESRPQAF